MTFTVVIVFCSVAFVAQGLEWEVCAQGKDLEQAKERWGRTLDCLIACAKTEGQPIAEILAPATPAEVVADFQSRAGGKTLMGRINLETGEWRWIDS